jgi:hypothetical protein
MHSQYTKPLNTFQHKENPLQVNEMIFSYSQILKTHVNYCKDKNISNENECRKSEMEI